MRLVWCEYWFETTYILVSNFFTTYILVFLGFNLPYILFQILSRYRQYFGLMRCAIYTMQSLTPVCVCLCISGGFTTFSQSHPELCVATNGRETESTILGLTCLHLSSSSSSPSSSSSCVFDDRFNPTDDETPPSPDGNSIFPVEVLPYLYLGNARNSADLDGLSRNGIKYILNVTPNVPNTFENTEQFHYLQIPINDHWSQNVTSYFPRAIAFIGKQSIDILHLNKELRIAGTAIHEIAVLLIYLKVARVERLVGATNMPYR